VTNRLHTRLADERGAALVLVVFAMALLGVVGVALIDNVTAESKRSGTATASQLAFQAAEAGIDDYLAKMVDNRSYYLQNVHPAESTRRDTPTSTIVSVPASPACTEAVSPATKPAPAAWAYSREWTYPSGKDRWCELANGFEYNLQIVAPQVLPANPTDAVLLTATGRKDATSGHERVVEVLVKPSSLAEYYRVVDGPVNWGAGAYTSGKIYANGNIDHDGAEASADIYAWNAQITGTVPMTNGAVRYDVDSNPPVTAKIKNKIDFAAFLVSFSDIQRAADVGGLDLDDFDPTNQYDGWRLTFQANGTVIVQSCEQGGGAFETNVPTCPGGAPSYNVTHSLPTNGAIYTNKPVIVSGPSTGANGPSTVDGRVTIASYQHIVIGGNISYELTSDDVLGLIAKTDIIAASWGPTNLTWRAGLIAQEGTWRGAGSTTNHDTMTFTGMAATADGGSWSGMFDVRNYAYDSTLQYLSPPWFPILEDPYRILVFRELPNV
jgi:type II secretory pathway pseudopilin PulG